MAGVPELGDRVHVPGIGTGTLRQRRGTRAVIELKGRLIVVPLDRLALADPPKRKPAPDRSRESAPAAADAGSTRPPALDLHGLTVPEALDGLDAFLNDALLAGHSVVVVVHGRSGGRIRGAVHGRLAALGAVRGYRIDPRNPGQTIVNL